MQNSSINKQRGIDFDNHWENKLGLIRLTSPKMSEKELVAHMFTGLNRDLRMSVMEN